MYFDSDDDSYGSYRHDTSEDSDHGWGASSPRRLGRASSGRGQPGPCWECGGPHRKADCPNITCFKCQGKGHMARDCMNPRKPRSSHVDANSQGRRRLTQKQKQAVAAVPKVGGYPKRLRMYHGTSTENATKIQREGFVKSSNGQLGPGVYLVGDSNINKAKRFAHDYEWRLLPMSRSAPKTKPALVEVIVQITNPKFITGNTDGRWIAEGYDAVRSESTALSSSSEWCLKCPSMVERVVRIHDLSDEGRCPWEGKEQCRYSHCPCIPQTRIAADQRHGRRLGQDQGALHPFMSSAMAGGGRQPTAAPLGTAKQPKTNPGCVVS
eukprot:TRINITY_DN42736_c0_g1_i2.p1 TRINITY_DN42736_c0_g1~~TRINITY_DN42736_c0_g1_i2.p1  ORF type:complete len:324 (+),score=25.59 TRINITY_DN42736_c0_g1_i2:79-1050(+)